MRAASRPMSSMGWRTVVSCGSISRPARIPSNPVTMTSSGTRTPASSRSLITPKAVWSVPQTKACGSLPDPYRLAQTHHVFIGRGEGVIQQRVAGIETTFLEAFPEGDVAGDDVVRIEAADERHLVDMMDVYKMVDDLPHARCVIALQVCGRQFFIAHTHHYKRNGLRQHGKRKRIVISTWHQRQTINATGDIRYRSVIIPFRGGSHKYSLATLPAFEFETAKHLINV
ncbi:hypothetical protein LMG10734_1674 [Bifidobacterium adolescentis]|nr:hypothetical protein LMG10734_1674 [Bifidobacterium adolescentis]